MTKIELDLARDHSTIILMNIETMLEAVQVDFTDFVENVADDELSIKNHKRYIKNIKMARKLIKEV